MDRTEGSRHGNRRPPETGAPSATAEELQQMAPGEEWSHQAAQRVLRTGGNSGDFTRGSHRPQVPGADAAGNRVADAAGNGVAEPPPAGGPEPPQQENRAD